MSSERAREIRLQTARELEARGMVDKAVQIFIKAGAPGEAARLLVSKERYLDAAKVMLDALGVAPEDAGRLEGRMRAAAEKTARCFELGGDVATASRLREALGSSPAASMGRPSMAPDVLPEREPQPSLPPAGIAAPPTRPPASVIVPSVPAPSASSVPAARVPASSSVASSPVASSPVASSPVDSSPVDSSPVASSPVDSSPVASSPVESSPRAPVMSRPSTVSQRPAPAVDPRSAAPSAAGTSSPGALRADEKWGRASGWKAGAEGGGDAIDLAIAQLLEQGKKNSAARVAWDAGRLEDAARWFGESGLDYETGAVLYDLGRLDAAMEALLRVSPDHKRHRVACVKLVDVASRLGRFDFELDRVLTQFAKAPPLEVSEIATYLTLAELYARNGFHEGARRVIEQVLLHDGAHEAARAALEALPPPIDARRAASDVPKRSLAQPIAVPGSRALPPLPTLEDFRAEARRHAPGKTPKRA